MGRAKEISLSVIEGLAVAAAYCAFGVLGRSLAFSDALFSAAWPPTGFALGLLLVTGPRYWPGIFLGAFLTLQQTSGSYIMGFGVGVGNTLEAVAGAYLVRRFTRGRRSPFTRSEDLFKFIAFAAVLAPMISATVGIVFARFSESYRNTPLVYVWFVWWLENLTGVLVFAPVIVTWSSSLRAGWNRQRVLEATANICTLALAAEIIFGGWIPTPVKDYPLEYMCIPILVWSAFRFGPAGAATSTLCLSLIAIRGTGQGFGPFYRSSPQESLHLLQMYIGTNGILTLTLAAIVSERNQTERQLARSNAELERFAYLASHDLQEPLRTISSFCRLLQRQYKGKLDSNADEYIELVVGAAVRMHAMINSLLEYSRLGKRIQFTRVESSQALEQAWANLKASVEESGATLRLGPHPLPSLVSDPSLLTLLFQNLLGNAIKFRGSSAPQIRISARPQPDAWIFSVDDNGIGIDPRYCEKVFKLFQRAVSDPRYPGAGVGLAICKKIVEEHGGKIWMQSKPGKGTRIHFTVPFLPTAARYSQSKLKPQAV